MENSSKVYLYFIDFSVPMGFWQRTGRFKDSQADAIIVFVLNGVKRSVVVTVESYIPILREIEFSRVGGSEC